MYKLIKKCGNARRGEFQTVHGTVQTPAFMNVATQGAIKGGVSAYDLKDINCQVQLCNTYHLHLRPTDTLVKEMGGLHKFTGWNGPILTDSGGFQVFSLASLRKIKEEGVYFSSHIDGRKIFMGPEESMQIQSNLGSTIAMAFDECVENPAKYKYSKQSCERTTRWLIRCKAEMERLNSLPDTINKNQLLFGINQGCTFDDLRVEHMKEIAKLDLDGYAIGRHIWFNCRNNAIHILFWFTNSKTTDSITIKVKLCNFFHVFTPALFTKAKKPGSNLNFHQQRNG